MTKKQPIQLSDHFTYGRLFKFILPSVAMMLFNSLYSIVDGLFVSRFAGKEPLAAINLIFPLIMILGAIGFMIGTGGTAIVAKTLGMGEKKKANEYFSLLVYIAIGSGIVLAILGILLARPISILFGAGDDTLEYCTTYAQILLSVLPFFMLQNIFQSFCITAEKPKLGFICTIGAGLTNIILDALFVGLFGWGLVGAAAATAASMFVGGLVPLIYFTTKNSSLLRLGKTKFYGKMLLHTCTNGSSELVSNISMSIVTILYNAQIMHYAGTDGVAAYSAIMYVNFIFISMFIGFVIGSAPIVSFNFGAGNHAEMKNLFKKCLVITSVAGTLMALSAILLSAPLSELFVGYDRALYEMTRYGFLIFSIHYIFAGVNIFGSSFFTALNNGVVSAIISFLRTLVFQCASVLLLPLLFEDALDGIWYSVIVAELLTLVITVAFLITKRKKYNYA